MSPQEQAAHGPAGVPPVPPLPPPVLSAPYAPSPAAAPRKHDPSAFAPTSPPLTREEYDGQAQPPAAAPPAYSPSAPPAYSPSVPPAYSPSVAPAYAPSAPPAYAPSAPVYSPSGPQAYPSAPPAYAPPAYAPPAQAPPAYAPPAPPPLPQPAHVSQPPPLPAAAFGSPAREGPGRDPDHVEPGELRSLAGFLVSYEQSDLGIFWPLYQGQNVLGRKGAAAGLDVEVDHPTTSSRHAVLYASARPARVKVEDTGSTNGTYVGELALERGRRHELRDGDVIRFGGFSAIVKLV